VAGCDEHDNNPSGVREIQGISRLPKRLLIPKEIYTTADILHDFTSGILRPVKSSEAWRLQSQSQNISTRLSVQGLGVGEAGGGGEKQNHPCLRREQIEYQTHSLQISSRSQLGRQSASY
jgi:hypothetical protein